MDNEKKYEAKIIGQAIGEEISKALDKNSKDDSYKEYRERDEYKYKSLLYFVNISVIISYIAGAMVMQLPFIDKFGIMSYDFKLYLLIGTIVFVIIQISVFISSIFEQLVSSVSHSLKDLITHKYNLSDEQFLLWIGRIIFIPVVLFLINMCEKWVNNLTLKEYHGLFIVMLLFIKTYVILSLIFQDKRYGSSMNITNFVLIIIALTTSLYTGRATFEKYLLTDAKLINSQNEKSIELLLIDNKTIYYKENSIYKYEVLKEGTIIDFLNDDI